MTVPLLLCTHIGKVKPILLVLILAGQVLAQQTKTNATKTQIVVTAASANVMSGRTIVARVASGQQFEVRRTNGPWYLITANTAAGPMSGWIHRQYVF